VLVGILIVQSSWFFPVMALMAGAMVWAGNLGNRRDWFIWIGMLVGFALFAELRARMGDAVELREFYVYVIQLETLGGLIPVPTVWLQENLQGGVLDAFLTVVYISFFFVPQVVVVYLWRAGGPFARYIAAACMLFGAALVIHFLLPTAPPWMASDEGLLPAIERIGIRVLTEWSPALTAGGYEASSNDVAAMPSVHQGLTVLAMIAMAAHIPKIRWAGWTYSLVMLLSIAYLGEHYLVDGAAGAAIAWGAWWLAGSIGGARSQAVV